MIGLIFPALFGHPVIAFTAELLSAFTAASILQFTGMMAFIVKYLYDRERLLSGLRQTVQQNKSANKAKSRSKTSLGKNAARRPLLTTSSSQDDDDAEASQSPNI